LVLNATPAERRAAEDELARQIRSAQSIPAYSIIPDEELTDRDKLEEELKKNNADGLVVLRLVATDKSTTYYPPTFSNEGAYAYTSAINAGPVYRGGYTVTTVVIRGEVSVYEVKSGTLLWAGSSTTSDPTDIQDLVAQVARATREELVKEGLLR
jgi:hypothetical protein